jgi:uncharacterized protein with FMN-binding domain
MTNPRLTATAAGTAGAGLAALLSLGACSTTPDTDTAPPGSSTATSSTSRGAVRQGGGYRDGTYTADGWYGGQPSRIGVSLTIADDTITRVTITTPATDETSLDYQRRFADAAPEAVIGKPLADVQVDRLAGASGCSDGFNKALALIRQEAAV